MTTNSCSIWTIGHSTRTTEEFIDLLRRYQIEILVDVRRFPGSRRLPHFNKSALCDALGVNGIRYEHLVELGVGGRCSEARTMSLGGMPHFAAMQAIWSPDRSAMRSTVCGDFSHWSNRDHVFRGFVGAAIAR